MYLVEEQRRRREGIICFPRPFSLKVSASSELL
jgi:hypothetical protein